MAYLPDIDRHTSFDEQVVASRTPILTFVPTWGASKINYDTIEKNGGTITSPISGSGFDGTIKLSTGTGSLGQAEMETKLFGQYQAGNQAEVGWGILIPEPPTGNQMAEWSYSTQAGNSGFGFGLDVTGSYIFYNRFGTQTKVRQDDWNVNTLSGSLDWGDGLISQVQFTWYGFGALEYFIQRRTEGAGEVVRTLIHRENVTGSLSVPDPNQPIRFDVENNGTADNFDVYVAGHQFSVIAGLKSRRRRRISQEIPTYELANTGSYQVIAAIRRKKFFNNRENSVNAVVKGFGVKASADMRVRLAVGLSGSVSNGTWQDSDWGDESASEIKYSTTGTILTLDPTVDVYPVAHRDIEGAGGRAEEATLADNTDIVLGNSSEALLLAKLDTAAANETVSPYIIWEEEW